MTRPVSAPTDGRARPRPGEDTVGLLRTAASLGRLGAWSWEVGQLRSHCTTEACVLLGLPLGSQPTLDEALACFTPADRLKLREAFTACLHGGSPVDVEAEAVHAGGRHAWVRVLIEPEWDAHGRVVRMQGALLDVTEDRIVRRELQESRRALATLVRNLPGMAYRCANAANWPLEFASERAVELTGYTPAELLAGQPHYGELINLEDQPRVWSTVQESLAQRRPFHVTYRIHARSGEKWVWEQGTGVFAADGSLACIEGFVTDISVAKRIEAELNELNQTLEDRVRERTAQLEAANAELEAFAYSIAHDLRAPMTSLAGFARLLEESLPDSQDRAGHYLGRIRGNVTRMSELTDALLSLARLSAVEMEREPVDLGELAAAAAALLREQEPGRAVDLRIQPGLHVRGDRRLLQQVMANLVGNAFKFSRGRDAIVVEVGCRCEPGASPVYFVRDHGVGFDMAHAARLFGAFQRLHGASEFEGTGIGLALVRKIVQRHGGRTWAEARPGEGATFFFTLGRSGVPPECSAGRAGAGSR